ncbi:MAG: hypothetical protein P4L60_12625 [Clostridium sp.]|nr:hypothetical protein [Clostridium sp.]
MRRNIRKYMNKPVETVGYPNENSKARPRKKLENMIHYECW